MSADPRQRALPPPPWVLVGLRGAGKTSVGRLLAEEHGRTFVDLDEVLERRTGQTIPELLAGGEAGFRQLEADLLRTCVELLCLGTPQASVLATGGGAVEHPESRRLLRALPVVYLELAAAISAERVRQDERARPALAPGGPLAEAEALFERRDPLYREVATHVVSAAAAASEVSAKIGALLVPNS
jgi:shikimate kinase